MKKIGVPILKIALLLVMSIALVMTAGCGMLSRLAGSRGAGGADEPLRIISRETDGSNGATVETNYGTFDLLDGWVMTEEHSEEGKPFYVKEGVDYSSPTSNISVEHGTNRYAREQHEKFREAILKQLIMQAGDEGTLTGSGTHTEAGDVLYLFTLESESDGITTLQYYIVGDKEYILVHATDFHNPEVPDVTEAAAQIADSFEWKV